MAKPFNIQDYLSKNKIEMGTIKKEVGDHAYKGGHNDNRKTNYDVNIVDGKLDLYTHKTIMTESKTINESMTITEFDDAFREFYDWIYKNSQYMGDDTIKLLSKAIQIMDKARKNEAEEHGARYTPQKGKL